MGLRFTAARAVSGVSTWGLKHVFHRPAANFPGKMALYVDPQLIAHLRGKLERGSVCVVGTNGKTTVSNLLADVLEASGQRVVCNRTGANLDSGVSTALLHAGKADWGRVRMRRAVAGEDPAAAARELRDAAQPVPRPA